MNRLSGVSPLYKIVLFFLLSAFSVLILIPIQDSLDNFMESLKRETIRELEERIGRKLVYEKISPSILLSFDIHNLSIAPFDSDRSENIHIGRLKVFYSPVELLKGNTTEAIRRILLQNATIRIDRQEDKPLLDFLRNTIAEQETSPEMEQFPQISLHGRNISLNYRDEGDAYSIEDLSFQIGFDGGAERPIEIDAKGFLTAQREKPIGTEEISINGGSTNFSVQAQATEDLDTIDSRVTLQEFGTELFSFRRIIVGIHKEGDTTTIRKIEDRSPWDLRITHRGAENSISASFAAEDFAFSDNITTYEALYPYSLWFGTRMSGTAEFTYAMDQNRVSYKADLETQVDNEFVPEPFTANFVVEGNEKEAFFEELHILSRRADMSFVGTYDLKSFFPEGKFRIRRLDLGDHSFQANLSISEQEGTIDVSSPLLLIDSKLRVNNIFLSGKLRDDSFDYNTGFTIEGGDNSIRSEGTVSLGDRPFIEAGLETRGVPVKPLFETFVENYPDGAMPFEGLTFSTTAFLSTDFSSSFLFSLQPFELRDPQSDFSVVAKVQGNNESIRLKEITAFYKGYEVTGTSTVDLDKSGSVAFDTLLRMRSEEYTLSGTYYKSSTLILRGNHGVNATLFLQGNNIAFAASAQDFPIPLEEHTTEISFRGRGRVSENTGWNAHLSSFSASALPGLPEGGSISLSLAANPERVKMWNIGYRDNTSSVEGEAWFTPKKIRPLEGNGWFSLQGPGEEAYRGVFSLDTSLIDGAVHLSAAPMERWKTLPVGGKLSGDFHLTGPLEDLAMDFSAQVAEGEYRNAPFALEANGRIDKTKLSIDYIRGNYTSHTLQKGEGSYDVNVGELSFRGEYRGTLGNKAASALVSIDADLEAVESIASIEKIGQNDFSAAVDLNNLVYFGKDRDPWGVRLEKSGDTLSLNGGPENAIYGEFTEEGSYMVKIAEPLPVRLISEGSLREGDISARVHDIFVDMRALRDLGFTTVLFPSGRIVGDFTLEGSLADPEFQGTLYARNVSGTMEEVAEPIEPFSTTITLDEKECRIEPVEITAGNGRAVLKGGFTFDRWTPSDILIETTTLGDTGIRTTLRLRKSGLSIDGYGLGVFSINIRENMIRLTGDVRVKDCVITLEDKEQPVESDAKTTPIVVDMDVETGPRVEFLWPRQRFPILSAYADTGQNISIYYNSLDERFRFTGAVDIKGGEVYYFQRSFYLREGTITFNETEESFNPLLDARAEIKEIDMTGHPVTISLIVDNEPLKSFTPRFESNPSLSTLEIAQILGTNIYGPPGEQQMNLTSALLLTGDFVSQFGVVRTFENQVKDVLNLDLFSLRTQIIQNVILERVGAVEETEQAGENFQQTDPLDRYLDNTTLFLGKYLGNDLFLEAMLQIRQQPRYVGEFQEEELNFTMEVGLEWKTPLFLLNLSVNPDFNDPKESLNNTRIGLSWDYSY